MHIPRRKKNGFIFIELQLYFPVLIFPALYPFADKMKKWSTSIEVIPNSDVGFVMSSHDWTVPLP